MHVPSQHQVWDWMARKRYVKSGKEIPKRSASNKEPWSRISKRPIEKWIFISSFSAHDLLNAWLTINSNHGLTPGAGRLISQPFIGSEPTPNMDGLDLVNIEPIFYGQKDSKRDEGDIRYDYVTCTALHMSVSCLYDLSRWRIYLTPIKWSNQMVVSK